MLFIPICFRWPESFCEMCMCRWACLLPISERPNFEKRGKIWVYICTGYCCWKKITIPTRILESIIDRRLYIRMVVFCGHDPIETDLFKSPKEEYERGREKLNRRKLKRKRKQLQLLLELNRFHLSSSSFSLISDQVGSRG